MTQSKSKTFNPDRVREADMFRSVIPIRKNIDTEKYERETLVFGQHGIEDERVNFQGEEDDEGYPLLWDIVDENEDLLTPADERPEACAKIEKLKTRRFFVKRDSHGKLLNPWGMYDEDRRLKQLKHTGRTNWEYREVNSKVCEMYLKFLASKNKSWLLNAQRELM